MTVKVPASKLLSFTKKEDNGVKSRTLPLKRYRINMDLVNLCRSYVILWNKKEWNGGRLTVPFDRDV